MPKGFSLEVQQAQIQVCFQRKFSRIEVRDIEQNSTPVKPLHQSLQNSEPLAEFLLFMRIFA
jgi:hypothetical protein